MPVGVCSRERAVHNADRSSCKSRSEPKGLSGLNVRIWVCSECGDIHDPDVNAAKMCGRDIPTGGGGMSTGASNQTPPLGDYNLFTTDAALRDAVRREGAAPHLEQLALDGAAIGSAANFEHGRLAN